jgi:hypothetical protein
MADLVEQLSGFRSPDPVIGADGNVLGTHARGPTEDELARPIVAPGTDALLPCAIEYQAPWEAPGDGLARHARAQVLALAQAGLPVVLRRLTRPKMLIDDDEGYLNAPHLTESDKEAVLARIAVGREVGYLRDLSAGEIPVAIRQLVISNATALENVIAPAGSRLAGFDREIAVYRSTIVYTPWERDTVAPAIVEVLNRCAEVWVQGEWAVDVFRRAGVQRVFNVPVPYDPRTSAVCAIPGPRGSDAVPAGKRFYAIGKWEPRKNYHALLGAFLLEFKPTERASLFIKTSDYGRSWKDYPSVRESIEKWLNEPQVQANGWTAKQFSRAVRIVSKVLPEEKLTQLHRDNNIYVSCSHGEGHDMPAFDARCAGNRLVYTGWSGPEEFAGPEDARIWLDTTKHLITPLLEEVHPDYGWESNARWAVTPLTWLRDALRRAQPPQRRVHPSDLYRRFGAPFVGARMSERLAMRFPQVWDKLVAAGSFG